MLKKISVLAVIILLMLSALIFQTYKIEGIIDVSQYGVVSGSKDASSDNLRIVNKLIRRADESATVVFGEGTYYFDTDIFGGISVKNKKDITINGKNTVFVNTSYSPIVADIESYNKSNIIKIIDSENVTISGICFDYINHTNASGVINDCVDGYTYFKLFDEYLSNEKNPIEGNEIVYGVNLFDKEGIPQREFWFDNKIKNAFQAADKENGIFKISGNYGNCGNNVCVRFTSGQYACPTIFVQGTSGLCIENTTVYTSPSAVVYAPCGNSNFTFSNFSVKPKNRVLFASNEDCIHIKGLKGSLKLTDCTFEGIGDDALNVHSKAAVIKEIDGNIITASEGNSDTDINDMWAKKGDEVEFFDKSFNSFGTAKVVGIKNGKIKLDNIPPDVGRNCILQNVSFNPDVTIDNCVVNRGRARGFLIQSANANITNCTIRNVGLSAILAAPDINSWYEVGSVKNLNIFNNSFVNCGTMQTSHSSGVVTVSLNHDGMAVPETEAVHGNISINNNIFKNTLTTKEIYIRAAENVKINNNILDKNIIDVK